MSRQSPLCDFALAQAPFFALQVLLVPFLRNHAGSPPPCPRYLSHLPGSSPIAPLRHARSRDGGRY